jgi:hydrogenase expression/formation protein HypE
MSTDEPEDPLPGGQCPIPVGDYPTITMAHGGGGRLSHMLVEKLFLNAFRNPSLEELHDGARLTIEGSRLALSTDSFVVEPLFFPGGDIGSLAVHGTVNDLAMCAARPVGLCVGLILEEGFPMEDLWRVTRSMKRAAESVGVPIVTGDTKVVDRGKGDGVFINTTGLGIVRTGAEISPRRARPGDAVLVSGSIAMHGMAIMSVREGLEFETELKSDSAPLHGLVDVVLDAGGEGVHVLRDPTRGGVASALNEISESAGVGILLDESRIPIGEEVRGACEILGLDPLYVANEGKCLVITSRDVTEAVLQAMRAHPLGRDATVIGEVVDDHPGRVFMRSTIGGTRVVDMLSGEQLPRIC